MRAATTGSPFGELGAPAFSARTTIEVRSTSERCRNQLPGSGTVLSCLTRQIRSHDNCKSWISRSGDSSASAAMVSARLVTAARPATVDSTPRARQHRFPPEAHFEGDSHSLSPDAAAPALGWSISSSEERIESASSGRTRPMRARKMTTSSSATPATASSHTW